jgi:NADPH:quinone reductase-like Zn-dependent oxidoreductase
MFAVYAASPQPDNPLAALTVGERPAPEPRDGWVRVSMKAASLNMHDLWTLRGVGIKAEQFPMILGCDGAGVLDDAACMGTAWLTAYRMLFVKSGLRPGQTMLVQGASGGVSTALIQLGRAAGFRVWVTGRSEETRALAASLGAHDTFESGARLPERVEAVFETVGKATWSHSMKSLKPGGIIVISGSTSGPDANAELQRLFFLQLRVVGSTMGTRDELADLLKFCSLTGIRPQIGTSLPLSDAVQGFEAMLAGETAGKIVFTHE